MPVQDTPSRLESAFVQRNNANTFYEQINISGSDLIFYHSSSGELTADRISVWAGKYGIGTGGGVTPGSSYDISASYASASLSSSYAISASYAISSSYVLSASYAKTASMAISSSYALSASYAKTSSFAISASWAPQPTILNSVASASWVSASVFITTAQTASYVLLAESASYAPPPDLSAYQPLLVTGNTYTITSSWSNNTVNANASSTLINRLSNPARANILDINQSYPDIGATGLFTMTQVAGTGYQASSYTTALRIYAYRIINSITYFSPQYTPASLTDDGTAPNTYDIQVNWNPVTDADGYKIYIEQYDAQLGDQGKSMDVGNVTSLLLTPSTPNSGDTWPYLPILPITLDNCYLNNSIMYVTASNALNASTASSVLSYNTYTDDSNYERLNIGWSNNTASIVMEYTGTGVSRPLILQGTASQATISSNGAFAYCTFLGGNGSDLMSYNCTPSFIESGLYGFKFTTPASNASYIVSFSGNTGSRTLTTASIGSLQSPTISDFTMSVVTFPTNVRSKCATGSIVVFGF